MEVRAKAIVPDDITVEITIRAKIGELQELRTSLNHPWSKMSELLLAAIVEATNNVRATAEQLIEKTPSNT